MTIQRKSTKLGVDSAQLFYNSIGTYVGGNPNFYSFFLGGASELSNQGKNTTGQGNNSYEDSEMWNRISVVRKIGKNDTSLVVPKIKWESGTAYHPWKSSGQDEGFTNFYVLNPTNNMVYLCISDNIDLNRIDRRGKSGSTKAPTHLTGIKTYSDNYSWLALYKIEWDNEQFVTNDYMPVPSETDYSPVSQTATRSSNARKFCGSGNESDCGTCCLYYTSSDYDGVGGITFAPGDLYNSTKTKCYKCIDMAERLGLEYKFTAGAIGNTGATSSCSPCENTVCACSIDYKNTVDSILGDNALNTSSNFKIQADNIKDASAKDGRIISAFIDLSSYTKLQRQVDSENPEITITSSTGNGAVIKLITSTDGVNYFVEGVSVITTGSLYRDYEITSAEGFENDIELNVDIVDGIAVNSRDLLGACSVMFTVRMVSSEIADSTGTEVSTFGTYGIAKNIEHKTSD